MALIKCPECGKNVSDKAHACPNCGYPLKAVSKSVNKKDKNGFIYVSNAIIGVFGFLLLCAVLKSNGGITGNMNTFILAVGMILGAILFIFGTKSRNKPMLFIMSILYAISVLMCNLSVSVRPSYLILEILLCANILGSLVFLKKKNII